MWFILLIYQFAIVNLYAYKNKIVFNDTFDINNPHIGRDNRIEQNSNNIVKEIIQIRILHNKKKLLDVLQDNNVSIHNKLKLLNIPNNDITCENILSGLKMDDFANL